MPDSPADKAEIQKGDVITHIAGNRVKTEEQFLRQLWEIPVHTEFDVTLYRKNLQLSLTVRGVDVYEFYQISGGELPGH